MIETVLPSWFVPLLSLLSFEAGLLFHIRNRRRRRQYDKDFEDYCVDAEREEYLAASRAELWAERLRFMRLEENAQVWINRQRDKVEELGGSVPYENEENTADQRLWYRHDFNGETYRWYNR